MPPSFRFTHSDSDDVNLIAPSFRDQNEQRHDRGRRSSHAPPLAVTAAAAIASTAGDRAGGPRASASYAFSAKAAVRLPLVAALGTAGRPLTIEDSESDSDLAGVVTSGGVGGGDGASSSDLIESASDHESDVPLRFVVCCLILYFFESMTRTRPRTTTRTRTE